MDAPTPEPDGDDSNEDGAYTEAERARMDAYGDKAFAVYESGLSRLKELAPDLAELLIVHEPVSLVPYRWCALAAAANLAERDAEEELGVVVSVEPFSTLTIDEAAFILAHEVEHLRRQHHLLERIPDEEARRRRGVAQDIVINDYLLGRGLPRPPQPTFACGELIGRKAGDCAELDWREVLALLPEQIPSDPGYYLRRLEGELPEHEPGPEQTFAL